MLARHCTHAGQDDQLFAVGTSIDYWDGIGGEKRFQSVMEKRAKAKAMKAPATGVSQATKLYTVASYKSAREGLRKLSRLAQ